MTSFRSITILFTAIAVLHFTAIVRHWYWTVRWLDIPMHYAGGVLSAMVFYWIFAEVIGALSDAKVPFWVLFMFMLGWVALVGVAWEFSEYLSDTFLLGKVEIIERAQQSLCDTMSDLFMDVLGGTSFAVFGWFRYNKR